MSSVSSSSISPSIIRPFAEQGRRLVDPERPPLSQALLNNRRRRLILHARRQAQCIQIRLLFGKGQYSRIQIVRGNVALSRVHVIFISPE